MDINAIKTYEEFINGYDNTVPLLRWPLAEHATKLLFGKGYDFTTKNKEFKDKISEWSEKNNLIQILEQAEKLCSLYGVAYVVQLTTDPILTLADPNMLTIPLFNDANELKAIVFWRKQFAEKAVYYLQEEYALRNGKCWVKRRAFMVDQAQLFDVPIEDFNRVKKTQVEAEERLPFDYIPIFPVFNKNEYVQNNNFRRLADWFHFSYLEQDYQSALINKTGERIKNQTYLIGTEDTKSDSNSEMFFDKYTKQQYDIFINKTLQSAQGEAKVEIISTPSKLPEYNADLQHIKEEFFNLCGYSFTTSEESAGADTATGQMILKGRDIETTLNKRRIRQYVYTKLFTTVFPDAPSDLSFIINENISIDSKQLLDQFVVAQQLGILSPAEMRSKYLGISIEQAEEDIKKITKESLEQQKEFNEMMGVEEDSEQDEGDLDARK